MSFYDPWHPTGLGNTKPVSVELFEKKYGGVIEYFPTTWASQYDDLSTMILSGEGIDFFPAAEAVPKCMLSGMTQSFDEYMDWSDPLWQSVAELNDIFAVGGKHYPDYGWTEEMLEMKEEVRRLTTENPVRDIYGGLPTDTANMISDAINQPIQGSDWYSVRDSIASAVDTCVDEVNGQISA